MYRNARGADRPGIAGSAEIHEKAPAMPGRAAPLVHGGGIHVAVIGAPGHGDRPRTEHDEREIAAMFAARDAGAPEGPTVVRYNAHLAERGKPEYRATLDAVQQLPRFEADCAVRFFMRHLVPAA